MQPTPEIQAQVDPKNVSLVPTFKNEIAPDLTQPTAQQQPQLEKDRESLEEKIEKIEERIESLTKLLGRSSESRLHNKVNELQEELCAKRFDLYVAQIHLSAVRSQLQLFEYNYRPSPAAAAAYLAYNGVGGAAGELSASALAGAGPALVVGQPGVGAGQNQPLGAQGGVNSTNASGSTRKSPSGLLLSATGAQGGGNASGSGAYRNKWIKALKSLKESPSSSSSSVAAAALGGGGDQK